MTEAIIKRFQGNPILTKDDVPYPVATVHNAGMVKHDGRYIMLFRSHRRNGRSILGLAESDDGFHFQVRTEPFMVPATGGVFAIYEEYGVEDPRICALEGRYLITYSAYSRHGVRIGLAQPQDFQVVERISLITAADCRNVVLFPRQFNGRYARAGPAPFRGFPLGHLDLLFARLDPLGGLAAGDETHTVPLGRNEDRSGGHAF